MTNIDKIRKMDEDKLATLLVRETFQEDIDYNLANSPYDRLESAPVYETVYQLPNGVICHGYEEALEECTRWLQKDVNAAQEE